jgi:hypothetical protein
MISATVVSKQDYFSSLCSASVSGDKRLASQAAKEIIAVCLLSEGSDWIVLVRKEENGRYVTGRYLCTSEVAAEELKENLLGKEG